MRIRKTATVAVLVAGVFLGGTAEKVGCSAGGGGGSGDTRSNHVEHQHEYKEWCKEVKEGDNSTYVYYFTDHKGHSGYRKGRANAQPFVNDPNYSVKRVC